MGDLGVDRNLIEDTPKMNHETSNFLRKDGTFRIAAALDAADAARRNTQADAAVQVLRHLFSAITLDRPAGSKAAAN